MLDRGLVSYIYDNLKKGYGIEQIRLHLLNYGKPQADIEEAIRYLQQYYPSAFGRGDSLQQRNQAAGASIEHHHKLEVSKKSIAALLIVVFIPLLILFAFDRNETEQPARLLDITTEPLQASLFPGESLHLRIELVSFGSHSRFDVRAETSIFDPPGERVAERSYVLGVETKSSEVIQLKIPDSSKPGRYRAVTQVRYDGIEEESSFTFIVSETREQGSCSNGIRDRGETGVDCGGECPPCSAGAGCGECSQPDPCTSASCVNGKCIYSKIRPCCGNLVCETTESSLNCPADCEPASPDSQESLEPSDYLKKALGLAGSNPEAAARVCDTISDKAVSDTCFHEVSRLTNVSNLCGYIEDSTKRDACYLNMAMAGDYSVCSKVQNSYLKTSCEQLRLLSEVNPPANYTEAQ